MAGDQPPIDELRRSHYINAEKFSVEQQECVRITRVGDWIGLQDDKEYATTPEASGPPSGSASTSSRLFSPARKPDALTT